jgi:hypothetical protein
MRPTTTSASYIFDIIQFYVKSPLESSTCAANIFAGETEDRPMNLDL